MTRLRLPVNPIHVSPGRRGRGAGKPAPQPVSLPAGQAATDVPSNEEPWLLDSREVSALLGIGRTKAFQMMSKNEMPVVRIGRCIRVPRKRLRDWIDQQISFEAPSPAIGRPVTYR